MFKNLNLKIEANKFNAIVGYSGGGKSTILNLMLKLYDQQNGLITFGGRDIREFKTSSILQRVGYVGQDSVLFDETIDANIKVGLDEFNLTDDQIHQLIKKSNAHDV